MHYLCTEDCESENMVCGIDSFILRASKNNLGKELEHFKLRCSEEIIFHSGTDFLGSCCIYL